MIKYKRKEITVTLTQLFFALLRAYFNENYDELSNVEKPTEQTLSDLYLLASVHDLAHVIEKPLKKLGYLADSPTKAKFKKAKNTAIFRYIEQSGAYDSICALLEEEKIQYVPLKGALIRDLYPSPEQRSACDIDILIHESDMEKALSLISEKLGFERDGKCFHDVSLSRGTVHLELHYNITEDDARLDKLLSRAWDYVEENENCKQKFTNEFFVFHVIAHMCHHFLHGGCGVKSLLDLWMIRKKLSYNEEKLLLMLDECELMTFYYAMCQLSDIWFSDGENTKHTLTMQKYILSGGAYGERKNRISAQKKENGGKLAYVYRRIFIPRRHLEMLYPALKDHPMLLPLCHVRRWLRVVRKGRGSDAINELSYAALPNSQNDKEIEAMLDFLGL